MDNDIKPVKPDSELRGTPPITPIQSPNPSQNNQVYGQDPANVQPQATPDKPERKKRWVQRWPIWVKILLFPIFALFVVAIFFYDPVSFLSPTLKGKKGGIRGVISMAQLVVGAILLAFAINSFVFQSYEVVGQSMLPTLTNGDRLVILKLGKTWGSTFGGGYVPNRGDVIVFDSPTDNSRQLIKRVIGLPGEKVIVADGEITVINSEFPQGFDPDIDYKESLPLDTSNAITTEVPEGEIFVAGDNRLGGSSFDSRNSLGTVPLENVIGSLALRILPFDSAKFF